ncbi:hypothetical protein D1872_331370 [compost metagenome]
MYSASQMMKGHTSCASSTPTRMIMVATYTPMATSTSASTNTVSRTASAVCITLAVMRPANSSW